MSGTFMTEIKQCVQHKKKNHGLLLCQNNVNGITCSNLLKVGLEKGTVKALYAVPEDHGSAVRFKSNLTFCVVCVFTLQTDDWFIIDSSAPTLQQASKNVSDVNCQTRGRLKLTIELYYCTLTDKKIVVTHFTALSFYLIFH
jgi:hypothetical protein